MAITVYLDSCRATKISVDRNDYLVHKSSEPSEDSEFPYLNSVFLPWHGPVAAILKMK